MGSKPLARLGMRVKIYVDNGCDHTGAVCQMFDDTCVVRLDKPRDTSEGDAPNVAAVTWDEVELIDVVPDPAQVTRPDEPTTPSPRCVVRPGMRVAIPTGDGNDDRPGTVVYALPECCVVRLDGRAKYAGHYTASDWNRVTMLDLAPTGEGGGDGK